MYVAHHRCLLVVLRDFCCSRLANDALLHKELCRNLSDSLTHMCGLLLHLLLQIDNAWQYNENYLLGAN